MKRLYRAVPSRQRLAHRSERRAELDTLVAERAGLRANETLERVNESDLDLVNRSRVPPELRVNGIRRRGDWRALGGRRASERALFRRLGESWRGADQHEREGE